MSDEQQAQDQSSNLARPAWRMGPWHFAWVDTSGARDAALLQQVAKLNHATFTQEIPQHASDPSGLLFDPLLPKSACLVCVDDAGSLQGMAAVCGERPFSLDRKLDDLDAWLPDGCHPCEFRLLAVAPEQRKGLILPGLLALLKAHSVEEGFDLGLISGTLRELKLYQRIGFRPFAHEVGSESARYQPMLLTWDRFPKRFDAVLRRMTPDSLVL